MNFEKSKGKNLLGLTTKGNDRFVLDGICYKNGFFYACNGHAMVKIPALDVPEGTPSAIIPKAAWETALNSSKLLSTSLNLRISKECTVVETLQGDLTFKNLSGTFPNTELYIEDLKPTIFITLDAKMINMLLDVLTTKKEPVFTIGITDDSQPIAIMGGITSKLETKTVGILAQISK